MGPVDPEGAGDLLELSAAFLDDLHGKRMHGCVSLLHEEQGIEHDRFGEGDGQNGLDHDLCRRAGISAHRGRCAPSDDADADGCAESRQTDMQASCHLVVLSCGDVYPCASRARASSCWQIRSVNTAVNSMNTIACTRPTSSSMK